MAEEAVWLSVHIALRRFDVLRTAFQAALQVPPSLYLSCPKCALKRACEAVTLP